MTLLPWGPGCPQPCGLEWAVWNAHTASPASGQPTVAMSYPLAHSPSTLQAIPLA